MILLPLCFITGFFGQNFAYLSDHIGGPAALVGLGMGMEVFAVAIVIILFRHRNRL